MGLDLYSHNITPYNNLKDLPLGENAVYVTATGTGKSFVAGKLVLENMDASSKALVITPRRSISKQWSTLDKSLSRRVDVVTYQYLSRVKHSDYYKTFSPYRYVIVDEVHHAGAASCGEPVRYCINNSKKLNLSVIGLTADPIRYSDAGYDVAKKMFSDSRVDGLTLEQAIKQKVLPPFGYVSALFDLPSDIKKAKSLATPGSRLEKLLGNLNFNEDNMSRLQEYITKHIPGGIDSDRHIIYFVSCKDDIAFAEALAKRLGHDHIYKMSNHFSKKDNDKAFNNFKKCNKASLVCIDMLNEGVHCKKVDTIVMLRRTSSPQIFFQQIGRALDSGSLDKNIMVFDFVANAKNIDMKNSGDSERLKSISQMIKRMCPQKLVADYTKDCLDIIHEIRLLIADKVVWTVEEDDYLREHYPTEGHECFSGLPNRSIIACRQRAKALGLFKICWTPEEDEILKKFYSVEGYHIVDRLNNKTQSAVANRAQFLGLKRERGVWLAEDEETLKKYYATEGTSIAPRLKNKYTAAQIKLKARSMDLNVDKNLWTKEEDAILTKYYQKGKDELMKHLKTRTYGAAQRRAGVLGLRKNYTEITTPWTDEELEWLRSNYANYTYEACAEHLNRSRGSVKAKLRKLGLQKR